MAETTDLLAKGGGGRRGKLTVHRGQLFYGDVPPSSVPPPRKYQGGSLNAADVNLDSSSSSEDDYGGGDGGSAGGEGGGGGGGGGGYGQPRSPSSGRGSWAVFTSWLFFGFCSVVVVVLAASQMEAGCDRRAKGDARRYKVSEMSVQCVKGSSGARVQGYDKTRRPLLVRS